MKSLSHGALRLLAAGLTAIVGCGPPADKVSTKPQTAGGAPIVRENTAAPIAQAPKKAKPAKKEQTGLDRALGLAQHSLDTLEKLEDYTCSFTKRERVGDELLPEERNALKVRHQPFSVYLRVIKPESSAGQEVIFVEGRNNGNLIAHTVGFGSNVLGRLSLDPNGFLAKRGNRYTIKDLGLKNLVKKLLELGARKELFRESSVKITDTEFAERPCKQVEITSPRPLGDFRLAIARIVLDKEWDVPVHFESHDWPAGEGQKPVLNETYSYYDVELDVGLTDRDFDPDNPAYAFP